MPASAGPQGSPGWLEVSSGVVRGDTAIAVSPTTAESLAAAVRAGVAEVRWRNGLSIAWLRIGLRVITLALWIGAATRGGLGALVEASYWTAAAVNAGHLVLAVAALLLLERRWRVPQVLLATAAVDVLVVAFAGWRTPPGEADSIAYLMGVMELILLFAALVLPRGQARWLAAAATLYQGFLGIRGGLDGTLTLAMVITLGVFSIAVTWAGTRMVELAARRALDDYTGGLLRAHRDELARANLEISAQRDQVLAAQAEAETLAKLIVHDLKNPLAALLQFVSLAESRLGDAPSLAQDPMLREAREDLRLAGEEGRRLAGMVGDLLLVSRLEHGALQPRLQPTPVAALLTQVARAAALRAADREVAVAVSADPDLMASLDLDLARRLVENLVGNALRFVDRSGKVELAAWADGGTLTLAVRNTGPVVPAAVRAYLFQKHAPGELRQVHNAGLGLYLCRLVAEAHGGQVALAETPGWPVAFEARLPLAP
jgi:signal transduction histidine kinase